MVGVKTYSARKTREKIIPQTCHGVQLQRNLLTSGKSYACADVYTLGKRLFTGRQESRVKILYSLIGVYFYVSEADVWKDLWMTYEAG